MWDGCVLQALLRIGHGIRVHVGMDGQGWELGVGPDVWRTSRLEVRMRGLVEGLGRLSYERPRLSTTGPRAVRQNQAHVALLP